MVQEQLVDYVSSQMKLGVSRDAIKSALVTAGWVAGDVEDTLKKVEGNKPVVSAGTSSPAKSPEPQMIRVSDLVSSSPSSSSATISSVKPMVKDVPKETAKIDTSKFGGKISGNTFEASPAKSVGGGSAPKGKMMLIVEIVGGVLILALAGLAWYFYSGNAALASQVQSLNSQSGSVTQQLTVLKAQMDASSTNFEAQLGSLTATNADLALNLSFYVVPQGTSPTSSPITVRGVLSGGGKAPYALTTTSLGGKIYVTNSSNASTSGMLKPLVGQTIQLSGTYVPGSDEITVASVTSSTLQ